MRISTEGELDYALWIAFLVLFTGMAVSVYAPTEPIVGVLPLWAVLALAVMLATVIVAAIAGIGYEWPSESR